jgi:(2Fe-2S) ferredoxin
VSKSKKIKTQRLLEGRFVGFVGKVDKKPKRMRIATKDGEQYLKLSKDLRKIAREVVTPGDWVSAQVVQTVNPKKGKVKLKAKAITPTIPGQPSTVFKPIEKPKQKTKECVMVCQKSSCRKRGAADVSQAISATLEAKGLTDEVAIKGTGCMKQCKKGPCAVFMPDKERYVKVKPQQVPGLIEKHFQGTLQAEAVS